MNQPMPANHYRVCGLQLASAIPFPELRALPDAGGSAAADIEFTSSKIPAPLQRGALVMTTEQADGTPWLVCTRTDAGYRFDFPGYADFFADRSGRRVTCTAHADTPPETVRHLFLDQVLPLLHNLRGGEALHASAVRVGGGICAFIGKSGQGKSTLAAAFQQAGNAAVCDDCLVLHAEAGGVRAEAAYPGLRLWEDSRDMLFGDAAGGHSLVSHYSAKLRIPTQELPEGEPGLLPLLGVYSLRREEGSPLQAPALERLSMRDALMELIEYAFRLDLADRDMILRQMTLFERIARAVPVRRLRMPDAMAALPAARDLVLRDLDHD